MDLNIAALLAQDGVITGAVYALLAVGIVLVFTVTRVIFVPQGDYVAYAALTMAAFQTGKLPGTVWLLLVLAVLACLMGAAQAMRERRMDRLVRTLVLFGALPGALALLVAWAAPLQLHPLLQGVLTLALVGAMGPLIYRVAYQPVAGASVLVLLIISVAVHLAITSMGLVLFGAEGSRTTAFSDLRFPLGPIQVTGQSLWVLGMTALSIAWLFWFFSHTFRGKALKATAVNRTGAQLMGIRSTHAGMLAFALASTIGALSGLLIGPITTIFYDTGFLIGLKGFVAAIIGGLVSYPLAAAGALLVGLLESYASFWASAFKEVAVFTLILPVLLWRSLRTHHTEEDEE